MVTVETISIVFTGLSISLAAFYYISTLRNAQRTRDLTLKAQVQTVETRQAQLCMQIVNQWSQPHLVEARAFYQRLKLTSFEDYVKIFQNHETGMHLHSWGCFVEGIGVLVRENYLDIKIVAGLMGGVVKYNWEKVAPYVIKFREHYKVPRSWIEWEYLYNELMRYAEKHPELGIQDSAYEIPERTP